MVDHAGVKHLGLEVDRVALLARMSRGEEVDELGVAVVQDGLEVSKGLGALSADELYVGHAEVDLEASRVQRKGPAVSLDQVLDQFPRMTGVGCSTDAGGEEHDPRLLSRERDPAGSPFPPGEVALAVRAEAAEVAERHVERAVAAEQAPVPISQSRHRWIWGRAGRLLPCPGTDAADPDAQIPHPAEG